MAQWGKNDTGSIPGTRVKNKASLLEWRTLWILVLGRQRQADSPGLVGQTAWPMGVFQVTVRKHVSKTKVDVDLRKHVWGWLTIGLYTDAHTHASVHTWSTPPPTHTSIVFSRYLAQLQVQLSILSCLSQRLVMDGQKCKSSGERHKGCPPSPYRCCATRLSTTGLSGFAVCMYMLCPV